MLTSVYREIPDDSIEGIKLKDGTAVDYLGSLIVNGLTIPKTGLSGTGGINGSTFTIGATEQILSASASILNTQYFMAANSTGSVVYAIITGAGNYGNMQLKDNATTRMYLKTDPTALSYINFLGGLVIGATTATFTPGIAPNYIAQVIGNLGISGNVNCYGTIVGGAVSTSGGASLQSAKTHYDKVTGNPHVVTSSEVGIPDDFTKVIEDAVTPIFPITFSAGSWGYSVNGYVSYMILGNKLFAHIYIYGTLISSPSTYIGIDLVNILGGMVFTDTVKVPATAVNNAKYYNASASTLVSGSICYCYLVDNTSVNPSFQNTVTSVSFDIQARLT